MGNCAPQPTPTTFGMSSLCHAVEKFVTDKLWFLITKFSVVFISQVQMNGTIVFNTITTVLEVIHSDLVSVIEGGTLRFVHKDDRIVMMGGLSYDPDDPTSTLT